MNALQRLVIQAILLQNGGQTPLPLLRSLRWYREAPDDGSLVPSFPPTLRYVTFSSMTGCCPVDVFILRRLRESCPLLAELLIDTGPTRDLVSSLARELDGFERLRKIEISECSGFSVFRDIATKANLSSLRINNLTGPWIGISQPVVIHDLRELDVDWCGGSDIAGLFGLVRFQSLEKLTLLIHEDSDMSADDIITLLHNLSSAVPTSRFQQLELEGRFHSAGWLPRDGALRDVLDPLLRLRNIRHFCLYFFEAFSRSDTADIEALAQAWPKLARLHLVGFDQGSALSANSLHHLYLHCPDLREVSLPVLSLPMIGVNETPTSLGRSSHRLRRLSITGIHVHGNSIPDGEMEGLARYILDLFPHLDTKEYQSTLRQCDQAKRDGSSYIPRIEPIWLEVMRHICFIQACSAAN